jgi:hypothetical protein
MPEDEPILRGELLEIVHRLDERLSSLDRNMIEIRYDIRHLQNWMIGLYLFIITVACVTIVKTF